MLCDSALKSFDSVRYHDDNIINYNIFLELFVCHPPECSISSVCRANTPYALVYPLRVVSGLKLCHGRGLVFGRVEEFGGSGCGARYRYLCGGVEGRRVTAVVTAVVFCSRRFEFRVLLKHQHNIVIHSDSIHILAQSVLFFRLIYWFEYIIVIFQHLRFYRYWPNPAS